MRLALDAGEHTLDLAAELGIGGVPIDGGSLLNDGVDATLKPLRERGLVPCQIGCFMFNPLSDDGNDAEAQRLRDVIPLASDAGCRNIVIGPGNFHPSGFGEHDPRNDEPAALAALADALQPMLDLCEQHDARLCIEPYLKGVINGPDRFKQLHDRLQSERLRANVDPSSLYDYADAIDPAAKVAAVCEGLVGHYGVIHLKEVALRPGFHVHLELAPIGSGKTDWADLLRCAAEHAAVDDWAVIEHVSSPEEAHASVAFIRDAASQAGVELK